MGLSGTDLAKQSADMVLLDDNFRSILVAIKEVRSICAGGIRSHVLLQGRRIYDNIQKFVLYLLSANSAEIWVMLTCVASGLPVPFSAVMILWANLVLLGFRSAVLLSMAGQMHYWQENFHDNQRLSAV
jgi:Ca2+-transporting ATPase